MNNKAMIAIALTFIVAVPIGFGYMMNFNEVTRTQWDEGQSENITNLVNNDTVSYYTTYTASLNNYPSYLTDMTFVRTGNVKTSAPIYGSGQSYTITLSNSDTWLTSYGDYYTVSMLPNVGWDIGIKTTDNLVTHKTILPYSGSPPAEVCITRNGSTAMIFGTTYSDVVDISLYSNGQTVTLTKTNTIIAYADASYGWTINTPNVDVTWTNGQQNRGIRYVFDMPSSSASIKVGTGSNYVILSTNGTTVYYDVTLYHYSSTSTTGTLGQYKYIMLEIERGDYVRISGLSAWPSMGVYPSVYNPIVVELQNTGLTFNTLNTNSSQIKIRVDATTIGSGFYPVANNATIDAASIKPGVTSYSLKFTKPEIVGDQMTFGGEIYTVDADKKITIGTKKIAIDNMVLSSKSTDGVTWSNTINGIEVSQTNAIATTTLSGVWSVILTLNPLTNTTATATEWVPGHFALDLTEASLIGIGVCAAMFIILGMTGKASGSKALLLGIACGCGALVFVMMI